MSNCNDATKRKITNEELEKNIKTLHQLAQQKQQQQDFEKEFKNLKDFEKEIQELKNEAETAKTDTKRQKALDKVKALELLKSKAILVFDNYKAMCKSLSLPVLAGNSKLSQMNELHRIFQEAKFTDEEFALLIETKTIKKTAIVIDKIFDEPREKVVNIGNRKNNSRPYLYQNKVGEGVIDLYIIQNEKNGEYMFEDGRMYATFKVLNENVLGLTEEKKQAYFAVMKKMYGDKLTAEQFEFCNKEVIRFIETDLYNGFWSKMILGTYLKEQGFDNSTGLRAVIRRKGTQKDGSEFYYRKTLIIPDSKLENEFSLFKKEFAEKHKITPPWHKHTTDYNMLYASKEEWNECLREFLAVPNEGLLKFVKSCNNDKEVIDSVREWETNKDYILSFRSMAERAVCKDDVIENLSKVFIIDSPEETIDSLKSTHIFTRDDQVDLKVAVLDRISEAFASRLQKKKTDRYYTVEASGIGEFTFKSKKLPKIMRTYESELMFCLVNSIETVEEFQKKYKPIEKVEQ